jgi:hypothetical protein
MSGAAGALPSQKVTIPFPRADALGGGASIHPERPTRAKHSFPKGFTPDLLAKVECGGFVGLPAKRNLYLGGPK